MGELILEEIKKQDEETATAEIEEAIRNGYMKTDAQFLSENISGGTCCVTALIRNGELFISNAGDCRAVLSREGRAEAVTSDHRPCREDERDRIESLVSYTYLTTPFNIMQESYSCFVYSYLVLKFETTNLVSGVDNV